MPWSPSRLETVDTHNLQFFVHELRARLMSADAWRTRVLDFLHDHRHSIVAELSRSVNLPSVSGSDHENVIQHELCEQVSDLGLDVDSWEIPLADTLSAAGFPGVEVDRREAWGLVARIPGAGSGEGNSLMFNAHVDVVPPGNLRAWRGSDPFSGHIDAKFVYGRGSCDMKGGLIAAMWVLRALARLQVPLRGDLLLACWAPSRQSNARGRLMHV